MRTFVVSALLSVVMVVGAVTPTMGQNTTQLPGLVGPDDREPINSREWPYSAIGRVNRSTGGYCTGVLIGPRHVLTVAHCLYDTRLGRWSSASDLHFVAGYNLGSFVAHMQVENVMVSPDYDPLIPEDMDNISQDWAIVTVRGSSAIRPIQWQLLSPEDVSAGLTDNALIRAGYGQDRAHMLSGHDGCSVLGWEKDMLMHDCDGTRGDSGSPILFQRYGQTTIVGLNVGFRVTDDAVFGMAIPAARFHDAARTAISTGQ